jgi:hypothetical protein
VNLSIHQHRILWPFVAVIVFLSMMAVAEYQIRSSPRWPPPPRHELGGWQIDDPAIWTLAAGLNLPATLPILMMSAVSESVHVCTRRPPVDRLHSVGMFRIFALVLYCISLRPFCQRTGKVAVCSLRSANPYHRRVDLWRNRNFPQTDR